MQILKNVYEYAKISDTPFDQSSLIHREVWFPLYYHVTMLPKNPIFLKKEIFFQNAKLQNV